MKQCMALDLPFVDNPESGLHDSDLIVDAIFGKAFNH
jgi:NAD(P)H-hydrate repair Nnr-like enzyme with NAD(P)H-hydrate epimerase domain